MRYRDRRGRFCRAPLATSAPGTVVAPTVARSSPSAVAAPLANPPAASAPPWPQPLAAQALRFEPEIVPSTPGCPAQAQALLAGILAQGLELRRAAELAKKVQARRAWERLVLNADQERLRLSQARAVHQWALSRGAARALQWQLDEEEAWWTPERRAALWAFGRALCWALRFAVRVLLGSRVGRAGTASGAAVATLLLTHRRAHDDHE